jgi:hypothetical protein
MAAIPHPPYSPDMALCDFFLFPKMKQADKLKGCRAGLMPLRRSRPNRRECFTLWQKRTSRKRSKNGEDGGTGVYMWEGTTSRVMAADMPYGEFYGFYNVSPEYFGFTVVVSSRPYTSTRRTWCFLPTSHCQTATFPLIITNLRGLHIQWPFCFTTLTKIYVTATIFVSLW